MDGNTETTASGVGIGDGSNAVRREQESSNAPDPATVIEAALTWVEENQTLATLGAFALGVFLGVMMRD